MPFSLKTGLFVSAAISWQIYRQAGRYSRLLCTPACFWQWELFPLRLPQRAELLDVALHTRHETGTASQCLFNSASHMHLWAQWVPWPLALHTAESEAGISNFTSTNGKAGVFLFVFSNQEAKLFIIVRQPLTPLPEEKPVLNHFQCQTFFIVSVFFWAGLLVKPTAVMTGCFPEGFQRGKKRKHWGMSQGWLKCYRCYLAHVIRGKGVNADIASVSQWVTSHAVRWWTYTVRVLQIIEKNHLTLQSWRQPK